MSPLHENTRSTGADVAAMHEHSRQLSNISTLLWHNSKFGAQFGKVAFIRVAVDAYILCLAPKQQPCIHRKTLYTNTEMCKKQGIMYKESQFELQKPYDKSSKSFSQ